MRGYIGRTVSAVTAVQRKENLIDKYESRLGEYLMKLTKHEMNSAQTRQASLYLHTINDFERIGDHASYIAYMSSVFELDAELASIA